MLLANVIETYLTLNAEEENEFQRIVSESSNQEVGQMLSIYEEHGISDEAELDILSERILNANSLAEMGLEEMPSNESQE